MVKIEELIGEIADRARLRSEVKAPKIARKDFHPSRVPEGPHSGGWRNLLVWGDNLMALRGLCPR